MTEQTLTRVRGQHHISAAPRRARALQNETWVTPMTFSKLLQKTDKGMILFYAKDHA